MKTAAEISSSSGDTKSSNSRATHLSTICWIVEGFLGFMLFGAVESLEPVGLHVVASVLIFAVTVSAHALQIPGIQNSAKHNYSVFG
jgi:hypothetical protein